MILDMKGCLVQFLLRCSLTASIIAALWLYNSIHFSHYFGIVAINDFIIESLLDTEDTKLLMDVNTAE